MKVYGPITRIRTTYHIEFYDGFKWRKQSVEFKKWHSATKYLTTSRIQFPNNKYRLVENIRIKRIIVEKLESN